MFNKLKNYLYGATTPLASIFGSGFLVIISVLSSTVGSWSLPAMALICLLAYTVGSVIRYNIEFVEDELITGNAQKRTIILDKFADIALIPSYIISVTLYLRILSSYTLGFFKIDNDWNEQLITSGILLFILAIGFIKGLKILIGMERWALAVTAVIIALVIGVFCHYDIHIMPQHLILPEQPKLSGWQIITILAGTLIVVQGFETTRYLSDDFDKPTRIRACRRSQIISTIVYLLFVGLATPLMHYLNGEVSDNGLMKLAGIVAVWLPIPLVLAAIFSQFSAAIADILGASGNIMELTKERISERWTYLMICIAAILLTWLANTLEILALASRAFALYYFLQCLVAITSCQNRRKQLFFVGISGILLFITLFAVPVS